MKQRWLTTGIVAVMSTSCSWTELSKPTPPDTSALRAEFAAPSGSLQGIPLDQATPTLLEAVEEVDDFCGFSPFDEGECPPGEDCARCPFEEHLGDMLTELAKALEGDDGQAVSIPGVQGTLVVRSICRGWASPSPDPAHGYVEATVSFSGQGLDPVVWGHAFGCEELSGASAKPLRYDGDFIVSYEPEPLVPYDRLQALPFILSYAGTIYDRDLDIEFPLEAATRRRLDGSGTRQFLVRTAFGSFVAELGMGGVVVRANEGSFRCEIEERACALL